MDPEPELEGEVSDKYREGRGRAGEEEEDEDSYIRDVAAMWGHVDLIQAWLPHHLHEPGKITEYVLFPAAMYGQLEVLSMALRHGDLLKRASSREHPGWSLMHFAVEGAQKNYPLTSEDAETPGEVEEISITNDMVAPSPHSLRPKSVRDILTTQLDIIYMLARVGADPAQLDDHGDSASFRAIRQLEIAFIEGAMLLDILTIQRLARQSSADLRQLETPGLSLVPNVAGWKEAVYCLTDWAYSRHHYEVLKLCHERKLISLHSTSLLVTSHAHTLRQCRNPLLIDALHREDYQLLETVLSASNVPSNVLGILYYYTHGNGTEKESVFSCACRNYFEGRTHVLERVLSLRCDPRYLTRITLSGVNLRRLPPALLHENLHVLDVRDNSLDQLPHVGDPPNPTSLGWRCPRLEKLNFTKNLLTFLHPDLFRLPALTTLIASANELRQVPMEVWTAPVLKHLELSNNMIYEMPCPAPSPRSDTFLLHSPLTSLPPSTSSLSLTSSLHPRHETYMYLPSWKRSFVSYNTRSTDDLLKLQVGFSLEFLDLSENRLSDVPRGLPCLAPQLNTLKLSHNAITNLGTFADYPAVLQSLDVSHNGVTQGIQMVRPGGGVAGGGAGSGGGGGGEGQDYDCLQCQLVEGHVHSHCSHFRHEILGSLRFLYLCSNRIEDLVIEVQQQQQQQQQRPAELEHSQTPSLEDDVPAEELDPPGLLYPRLQALKVSENALVQFPCGLHRLTKLQELVVSGNRRITEFPPGLHKLTSLFTFRYADIQAPIVRELANLKTTAEVLYYLKARELRSCSNTSMRLFVIGHHAKGKTTLLKFLSGASSPTFDTRTHRVGSDARELPPQGRKSTVGIECGKWVCSPVRKSVSGHTQHTPINFYTWDFAGQEEYYVTHQFFLTNRALYLLVWNVLDGEAGIQSLSIWLQNLQARAGGSPHTVLVVGTHLDQVPVRERERKCQVWRDKLERYRIGRSNSHGYPIIVHAHFVGCPTQVKGKAGVINIDTLNNLIHAVASDMEAPRNPGDWHSMVGFKLKILQEKIPQSYDNLRQFVEQLPNRSPVTSKPALHKKEFYEMVSGIIEGETEVETAVDYLHATTGVILHFNLPVIKEYYVVNPQRWFDLCALVISPNNVSNLVRCGRPGDERFGLLKSSKMNEEFQHQGCSEHISRLIRSFLNQLGIIHQVNRDYCLVPSAIHPDPSLSHRETVGTFPREQAYQWGAGGMDTLESPLPSVEPLVESLSACSLLGVKRTGVVYRRMLLLPPIASGFWSKLIALCLQKQDFQQIVLQGIPREHRKWSLQPCGPAHRLRSMIGDLEVSWTYWKTGIILFVYETPVLLLHSLRSHDFEDPLKKNKKAESIFQSRVKKLKSFIYEGSTGWTHVPPQHTDVIEVVVPEVTITVSAGRENLAATPTGGGGGGGWGHVPPMSSKILVKALEMVDEVLKSHCEHLATTGIYSSTDDMLHVVPCPLEYGDRDERHHDMPSTTLGNLVNSYNGLPSLGAGLGGGAVREEEEEGRQLPHDCICVFTVDALIKTSFTSDVIVCPKCGPLELEFLAPDLVFADVTDIQIDKTHLSQPVSKNGDFVAKGGFGIVYKRTLHTQDDEDIEVAVKLFEQDNLIPDLPQTQSELTRSYSDMRYELNKFCSLQHPHIIRFIGVITNPHCFVLEWAPLLSLETQRMEHSTANMSMCYTSILQVLLQVTNALSYLHSPHHVGIVHRDLKSSNILVFRFPGLGHSCFVKGQQQDCRVLVKITDMGICANPLATKARADGGLRILVPECISSDAFKLTEKVDIFTLGSCVYEMLSLRALPPSDVGEPHYKQILLSGKRPQFFAKDTAYPPLLFQVLEDCWQQEHYLRPSAELLHATLSRLTGLRLQENQPCLPADGASTSILLDSFTLHQQCRVSAAHCQDGRGEAGLRLCAAVSGLEGTTTDLVVMQYDAESDKSEMLFNHIGTIKNTEVVSIRITSGCDIFVACSDGTIAYYDSEKRQTSLDRDAQCRENHGGIVQVQYCEQNQLLVVAFEAGAVHMRKCIHGIHNHFAWRGCCLSVSDPAREIFDVECLYLAGTASEDPVFELWLGVDSESVEVWQIPIPPSLVWGPDSVAKIRRVSQVKVACFTAPLRRGRRAGRGGEEEEEGEDVGGAVRLVRKSADQTMVATVWCTGRGGTEVAVVSMESKQCLRTITLDKSVMSVLLTPAILALGLHEGDIYIYRTPSLLTCRQPHPPTTTPPPPEPRVLHGHLSRVYALHSVRGCVSTEGSTSLFLTFVGRADEEVERDYLISIGFGRGYPFLSKRKIFKKSCVSRGSFINVWVL